MTSKFSDISKQILEERYYLRDDNKNLIEKTPEELFHRVSDFIAQAEKKLPNGDYEKYKNVFYDVMIKQEFMPASPILFNAGTSFPMLSSCFALPVHDNMESILKTLNDSAMIFKYGGGVGWNFSELRPENSPLSSGGTSSGPCSFISLYNEVIEAIKQGGKRRGAGAAIMDIEHPDVEKFILKKRVEGEWSNINISVICTNKFMDRVFAGEERATYLWDMVSESNWSSGDPNIIFIDTMNKYNTIPKYPISTVNPCLPGWTIVLTKTGPKKLKDLIIGEEIWSEDGWVIVNNIFNQGIKKVYKYETACGDIYATDNHNIKSHGFKQEIGKSKDIDLLKAPLFENYRGKKSDIDINDYNISLETKPSEFSEEINGLPINVLTEVIRVFFKDLDYLIRKNSKIDLLFYHKDEIVLKNIQTLLSIFGIESVIINSIHNNYKLLIENIIEFILITELDIFSNDDIKRIISEEENYQAMEYVNDINTVKILNSKFYSEEEVFDISVSGDNHTFWANGFNVSNCHEICMSPYESCNLSGINLDKMLKGRKGNMKIDWDKLGKLVKIGHRFLDNNIEMCFYPIKEIEDFAKKTRRQGLYFFGLAPFLIKLGLRYGSQESLDLIDNLFCFINRVSLESTIELGKERGNFPDFEDSIFKGKYKYMRSSNRLTIAPSGTTSRISDSYFAIEPYFSWEYDSRIMDKVIHEKFNIYDEYKDIYPEALVTAHDITAEEHLMVMATIGRWIDASISKSVNLRNNSTIEDVSKIMKLAYKFGLKAIAIYRDGCKSVQVLNNKKDKKKFNITRSELIELYIKKQMTQQEIAEQYDVSQSLVALRLKEFEIPRRSGRTKKTQEVPDIETIEFLINKGLEIDEISKFFNIEENIISDIIECNKNENIDLTRSIPLTPLIIEFIEGELLGRGELIKDSETEGMAYLKYSSNDYDYVCWLDRIFSSERLIKKGNIEEMDGIFSGKTISCSELYNLYQGWYYDGQKRIPDNFNLTPNITRQWFISDLTSKENGHFISFDISNFKKKGINRIKRIFNKLEISFDISEDGDKLSFTDEKNVDQLMKYMDESIFEIEKSQEPIQCKGGSCQI